MPSSSSSITNTAIAVSAISTFAALSLTLLQTDRCSRWFYSAEQLYQKRHYDYRHEWTQFFQKAVANMQKAFSAYLRVYSKNASIGFNAEDEALLHTSILQADSDLDQFIHRIMTKELTIRIARIGTTPNSQEFFIWLLDVPNICLYQVPLTKFATKLAMVMEQQVMTTTLCFLADASAGAATNCIVNLVRACAHSKVVVLDLPLWLVNLAVVSELRVLSQTNLEKCVFALLRLEAWRLLTEKSVTTILVPLCQATTPALLPLLQSVFPDDRHVFAYTSCTASVRYYLQQQYRSRWLSFSPKAAVTAADAVDPKSSLLINLENTFSVDTNDTSTIVNSTPLIQTSYLTKSSHVMTPFCSSLSVLDRYPAALTESWMAAVHALVTLQLQTEESQTLFTPYVCKMEYILDSHEPLIYNTSRYWALRSLLQYIMGNQSKELSSELMDAAISFITDMSELSMASNTIKVDTRAIENAVFQHKLILIENKTLKDTVQPAQHWTLKAAVKQGCACCLPDDEEEQEKALARMARIHTATRESKSNQEDNDKTASTIGFAESKKSSGYVDGKTVFAFDPTRFTI